MTDSNEVEFVPLETGEATVVITKPNGDVSMQHLTAEEWARIQHLFGPKRDTETTPDV